MTISGAILGVIVGIMFVVVNNRIDRSISKQSDKMSDLEEKLYKTQNVLFNLCRDLDIADSSFTTDLTNHHFNPFRNAGINNISTIRKLYTDIKMLHDYLGVKLEPSKVEPEKLVKVKKEVKKWN